MMTMKNMKRILDSKATIYILLGLFSINFILPFGYALYTSLLAKADLDTLVPLSQLTFENYIDVFLHSDVMVWFKNSLIMTMGIVTGNLIVNTLAGYALAKLQFPGKKVIFFVIIATMMVPYQICLIPTYSMLVKLGWLNSFKGLIIPFLFQGFLVFLMRQYFMGIPDELLEAAKIDGLGPIRTFFKIVLPISQTGIATQLIFSFTGTWNSFLWPSILVNDKSKFVLTVGLNTLKNQYFEWPNLTMTGVVLITIPIVVVFMFFQRYFVAGVATSGIKN